MHIDKYKTLRSLFPDPSYAQPCNVSECDIGVLNFMNHVYGTRKRNVLYVSSWLIMRRTTINGRYSDTFRGQHLRRFSLAHFVFEKCQSIVVGTRNHPISHYSQLSILKTSKLLVISQYIYAHIMAKLNTLSFAPISTFVSSTHQATPHTTRLCTQKISTDLCRSYCKE